MAFENYSSAAAGQVITLPQMTNPTIYYVAESGSDDNDGLSSATPWRTINPTQHGLGDGEYIFLVDSGNYAPMGEVLQPNQTYAYLGNANARPVIQGNNQYGIFTHNFATTLSNFTFAGCSGKYSGVVYGERTSAYYCLASACSGTSGGAYYGGNNYYCSAVDCYGGRGGGAWWGGSAHNCYASGCSAASGGFGYNGNYWDCSAVQCITNYGYIGYGGGFAKSSAYDSYVVGCSATHGGGMSHSYASGCTVMDCVANGNGGCFNDTSAYDCTASGGTANNGPISYNGILYGCDVTGNPALKNIFNGTITNCKLKDIGEIGPVRVDGGLIYGTVNPNIKQFYNCTIISDEPITQTSTSTIYNCAVYNYTPKYTSYFKNSYHLASGDFADFANNDFHPVQAWTDDWVYGGDATKLTTTEDMEGNKFGQYKPNIGCYAFPFPCFIESDTPSGDKTTRTIPVELHLTKGSGTIHYAANAEVTSSSPTYTGEFNVNLAPKAYVMARVFPERSNYIRLDFIYNSGQNKYYIDAVNGNDTNEGTSWEDAFKTIPWAFAGVQNRDVYLRGNFDLNEGLVIPYTCTLSADAEGARINASGISDYALSGTTTRQTSAYGIGIDYGKVHSVVLSGCDLSHPKSSGMQNTSAYDCDIHDGTDQKMMYQATAVNCVISNINCGTNHYIYIGNKAYNTTIANCEGNIYGLDAQNCLLFNAGTTGSNYHPSATISATEDPFVEASARDYHLADGEWTSAGETQYLATTADKDWIPWAEPPSVGAYQFVVPTPANRSTIPNDFHPLGL